jgi:protein involved in polysaccharide export with SLBB domain
VNSQSRGGQVVPTSIVVRALAAAAGVTVALGCASSARVDSHASGQLRGQAQVQGAGTTRGQTRRQLEQRAAELERQRGRTPEAAALRARLRDGDFQVGDAIVLNVVGVTQFSDTFPVRAGRVLQLPEIAPIPLAGVLRSEIQPHLRRHLGRYVINPTVEAYTLVRLAVAGGVAQPGFYEVRPDAPVTDAVMRAGGLAADGDATKLSLRRAGRTIIPEDQLRARLAMGSTLDDLNIRAGDEIRVGERRRRDWLEMARTLAYVAVVATGIWASGHF